MASMKCALSFAINQDFDLTIKDNLKAMSVFEMWDSGLKKYVYVFPLNKLNEVIAITGKTIDLTRSEGDILNLLKHVPTEKAVCEMERYKGEGFVHIQRFKNIFHVSWPQRKKTTKTVVPNETVQLMWEVIKNNEIGKAIPTPKISEAWCRKLKLTRFYEDKMKTMKDFARYDINKFFREGTLSFDNSKFVGTRKWSLLAYSCLKILQHYSVIEHHRAGFVERLKDDWDINADIRFYDEGLEEKNE